MLGKVINPESAAWIIPLNIKDAENGDAISQLAIASAYARKGGEENFQLAEEWYQKAYLSDYSTVRASAARQLAWLYESRGENEQARLWFLRSYEIDKRSWAAYKIASLYTEGADEERFVWYARAAADRAYLEAHCTLAYLYENGIGTDVNGQLALRWLLSTYKSQDIDDLLHAVNDGNEKARQTLERRLYESHCRNRQFKGSTMGWKTIDWYLGLEKETEQ